MKLRLCLLALCLCLGATQVAEAQEEKRAEVGLYYQGVMEKGEVETNRLFLQGYHYLGESRLGVWGFAYGEDRGDYFSGVLGLYYDFLEFGESSVVELGLAAGTEKFRDESGTSRQFARYAGTLYIGNDQLNTETYYEYGPSSDGWLRVEALWQVRKYLAIGALHQSDDGTGPRVILSVPKTPLRLSPALLFDKRDRKFLLAGELVFNRKR